MRQNRKPDKLAKPERFLVIGIVGILTILGPSLFLLRELLKPQLEIIPLCLVSGALCCGIVLTYIFAEPLWKGLD